MPSFIFKTMAAALLVALLWGILLIAADTDARGQIDPCQQGCLDELHACQLNTPYSYNHCVKQYYNCLKRQCKIIVSHSQE